MSATDFLAEFAKWFGGGMVLCVVIRPAFALTWSAVLAGRSILFGLMPRK